MKIVLLKAKLTVLGQLMNKHFPFSLVYFLFLFFITSSLQAQETTGEDDDTLEIEVSSSETAVKVVTADSLYLLQDTKSEVYNRKFETKFKEKYKDKEDFVYEEVQQKTSVFQKIKQALNEWFRRNFTQKIGEELDHFYYVIFLRILGFLLFGFIAFYLIKAFIQKDIYWLVKKKGKKVQAFEVLNAEDFKTTDFETSIHESVTQKQYRLAIRMYYLWLLQRLQEQEKIIWTPEKTNADYSYELKDKSEKEDFSYLSYLYNNIWYGEYELTEADFFKAKNAFDLKLKPNKS